MYINMSNLLIYSIMSVLEIIINEIDVQLKCSWSSYVHHCGDYSPVI